MSSRTASSQSNSHSSRHASLQGTLYAPATPSPRLQGNRRHSQYPIPSPLSLCNRTARISSSGARVDQSTTATFNDSHSTASRDTHALPRLRASVVGPRARKTNFSSPTSSSKLQNAQSSELFECTSPLEFGSQEAASLQGIPDTSLPICSTPTLSKSPASPSTPPSPSTPSQHASLANLDLRSFSGLLAFQRDSLASRQRTSAMTSLGRSHSYRPSPPHLPFLSPDNPSNAALFTPKGRSSYNPGMPNPLTGEPPKSAFPPSSSEARRMRRQGVDFHSIPEFAKKYNLSGPDFQPDYTFETGSSIISPSTHGQVQCESISESEGHTEDTQDTQTESEFDAEADYSWEAEDSEDSPDPLDLDGLSELGLMDPGGDGNFHSDENSFHDFFYSRQETVEDDIFSQSIVVQDIESLLLTSSSASSTLTPPPPQRSHSHRPVLSPLTLPSIIEPCLPTSSPMDPYMEQHLLDRSSVPAPSDFLITIDPGSTEISNSKSQEHPDGEPPRSAFDSDSDLSCNEDVDSRRHSRRSPSKPPGKLRRLKDALKSSISMPSMRAAKAKHAQASGEGTSSRSSSRFSHLPPLPNSPKVSSHGHTASMVSTISGISMTSRTSSTPTTSPSTATSCSSLGRSQAHLSPLEHLFQRDDSRRPYRRGSRTSSVASFSPHTPNSPSLEVDHVDQRRLTNNLTPSSYPRPRTRPRTSASSHSTNSSYTLNHNSHIDITKAEDVWRTENLKRRTTSPLNPSKSLSNLSTPTTPPNIPLPPLPPLPPVGTAHLQSFEHLSHSAHMTPASGSVKELPSDTPSPVAVTVTDTNNTTYADANANVDVGMENRKVLLAESLARLQAHKPQTEAYTWGSSRPALPSKIQWIATGSDLKTEDKPKLPAKRPSVVVSPTTLQRLDFSSLTVSPASCYSSDDQPSQDASSASLLLDVTEMAGRDASRTEGVNRIPLLPEFDFERPKYPASLKDGSCGQHKKPALTHHIRKTSSLSDLPRLLHLHNTKDITMRSTHNLTHPPRFANLSTSSAESSALQTPSDSTSPAISRASSTTSSYSLKPIQLEPVQPMGDAKAVIPFLYRQLNNGFLSSTTLRPPRSASEVSLPTDEQHVIPTSIQRESPKGRGEKKSKVSKLLERVGSSKSVRGSLSIRN